MKCFLYLPALLIVLAGCNNSTNGKGPDDVRPSTPLINYAVSAYYPHDTTLYTEGFLFHDGKLFESSGAPGNVPFTKSVVGISDLSTGKFDKKIELDKTRYFGEGIAFFKDKLYQLTYQTKIGFIYNANTFKQTGQFTYNNAEGWGMTADSTNLIMSDGTGTLTYLDPATLGAVRSLTITENGMARDSLNELEYIKGYIYANIWLNNTIIKIDPKDGKVVGKLDLTSLVLETRQTTPQVDVLNGIAYDSATDKIYVTGKLWPTIYQVSFNH